MPKMRSTAIPAGLAAALACVLVISGCTSAAKKVKGSNGQDQAKTGAETTPAGAYTPPVDVTEASLRGTDFAEVPSLETIHFDYDSAQLSDASLASLKKNAAYLQSRPELEVRVAGYCDERGTIEYNMALGQKRAKEVRDYYVRLGVAGDAVATISYGKESPLCTEATEECWAQNRRGETRVRMRPAPGAAATPAAAPVAGETPSNP